MALFLMLTGLIVVDVLAILVGYDSRTTGGITHELRSSWRSR